MMKKLLFTTVMLFAFAMFSYGQVATDGDYRSVASGNWTTTTTWEVRNSSGVWSPASVAPSATNNVYLQTGHAVVIDAPDVYCKDLHFGHVGTVYGSVTLGTNKLNVNGKVRVFTGALVNGLDDSNFYTGQGNSTATNSNMFLNSGTSGVLKFVGGTRNITNTGEWNSNGTVCYGEFALDPGAEGTLQVGMKFRGLTVSGGKVINLDRFAIGSTAGSGDFLLKNGAIVQFERSGLVSLMASNFSNPINPSGKLEIEAGGILIFKSTTPAFNFSTYVNNGTIIYNGTGQTLLQRGNSANSSVSLDSYHKLEISSTDGVEIPANTNITVADQLTLTSGKLIIPETSTLTLSSGNTEIIGGSLTSYIETSVEGSSSGLLKVTGLSTSKSFPVGSGDNYTPVTLTPSTSSNFEINVFEGATVNALPNGTALTADQKKKLVNAVWNINRTSGSGNCEVTLGWPSALEGTDFAGFGDTQIGIASYSGGAYSTFTGSGDNTANKASLTISDFSPLIVGELNTTLPVKLIDFTVKENLNSVKISWKTTAEQNLAKYIVQHAYDGSTGFKNIYSVAAHNLEGTFDYSFVDMNPVAGANYYRLVSEDLDGTQYISEPKSVNINGGNLISTYPNPIADNSFNISGLLNGDIVKIIDLKGQVVLSTIAKGNSADSINVQHVKPGVYVLSVENAGKITTTKRLIRL